MNIQIQELLDRIDVLIAMLSAVTESLTVMTGKLDTALAENASLKGEIALLRARLDKDSHNSSRLPSSDSPFKPSPGSLREKSGKKPGGQKGHKGYGIIIPPHAERKTVRHLPADCASCPSLDECKDLPAVHRHPYPRLSEHRDSFCRFIMVQERRSTTPAAERDIRARKVEQKVSGCMRTENGADDFAAVLSCTYTARRNGMNIFSFLRETFPGSAPEFQPTE